MLIFLSIFRFLASKYNYIKKIKPFCKYPAWKFHDLLLMWYPDHLKPKELNYNLAKRKSYKVFVKLFSQVCGRKRREKVCRIFVPKVFMKINLIAIPKQIKIFCVCIHFLCKNKFVFKVGTWESKQTNNMSLHATAWFYLLYWYSNNLTLKFKTFQFYNIPFFVYLFHRIYTHNIVLIFINVLN